MNVGAPRAVPAHIENFIVSTDYKDLNRVATPVFPADTHARVKPRTAVVASWA